jgi:hypothetical protein
MIVHNLNVVSVPIMPREADAPLVIDADAVLSCAVATKLLKTIGRWSAQVSEGLGVAEHAKFTIGYLLDVVREFSRALTGEDLLGFLIPEGLDHNLGYNELR